MKEVMSHINAGIFRHCLLENSLSIQTNQKTETYSDTISGITATEEPHLNLINLLGDSRSSHGADEACRIPEKVKRTLKDFALLTVARTNSMRNVTKNVYLRN